MPSGANKSSKQKSAAISELSGLDKKRSKTSNIHSPPIFVWRSMRSAFFTDNGKSKQKGKGNSSMRTRANKRANRSARANQRTSENHSFDGHVCDYESEVKSPDSAANQRKGKAFPPEARYEDLSSDHQDNDSESEVASSDSAANQMKGRAYLPETEYEDLSSDDHDDDYESEVASPDSATNQRNGRAFPPKAGYEDLSSESDVDEAQTKRRHRDRLSKEELVALGPGVYKVIGAHFMDTLPISSTPHCDCYPLGRVKKGDLIRVQEVVKNDPARCPDLTAKARQARAGLPGWFYGRIDEPMPGWVALASSDGDIYSKRKAEIVLTIDVVGEAPDGSMTIECTNLAGDLLASLDVGPDELLIGFKKRVRKEVRRLCVLVMRDGRQFGSEHDQTVLKTLLDGADATLAQCMYCMSSA